MRQSRSKQSARVPDAAPSVEAVEDVMRRVLAEQLSTHVQQVRAAIAAELQVALGAAPGDKNALWKAAQTTQTIAPSSGSLEETPMTQRGTEIPPTDRTQTPRPEAPGAGRLQKEAPVVAGGGSTEAVDNSAANEKSSTVAGAKASSGGAATEAPAPHDRSISARSRRAAAMIAQEAQMVEQSQPLLRGASPAIPGQPVGDTFLSRVRNNFGTAMLPPPQDTACPTVSKLVDNWLFQTFITAVVVANCAVLSLRTDADMQRVLAGKSPPVYLMIAGHVFMAIFVLELVLNLIRCGELFFYEEDWAYNYLDLFLVIVGVLDVFLDKASEYQSLRILRFVRLTRILRVMKLVARLKPLRAILVCIACSASALISSVFVLTITIFMGALLMVSMVETYLEAYHGDADIEDNKSLTKSFDSVYSGMLTMGGYAFGGGDWIDQFVVLEAIGRLPQVVLVGFVIFSQLALLNVISAIFLDTAMKNMVDDLGEKAVEHQQEQRRIMQYVTQVLEEVDLDANGALTSQEWSRAIAGGLLTHLESVGIRANDANELFELFASQTHDERVPLQVLVDACIGFKGVSTPLNVLRVQIGVSNLERRLISELRKIDNKLEEHVQPPHGAVNGVR